MIHQRPRFLIAARNNIGPCAPLVLSAELRFGTTRCRIDKRAAVDCQFGGEPDWPKTERLILWPLSLEEIQVVVRGLASVSLEILAVSIAPRSQLKMLIVWSNT
jgi:hypothetical protein